MFDYRLRCHSFLVASSVVAGFQVGDRCFLLATVAELMACGVCTHIDYRLLLTYSFYIADIHWAQQIAEIRSENAPYLCRFVPLVYLTK